MIIADLHFDFFTDVYYRRNEYTKFNSKDNEQNIFYSFYLDDFKQGEVFFSIFNFWLDYKKHTKVEFYEMLDIGFLELNKSNEYLYHIKDNKDMDMLIKNPNTDKVHVLVGVEGLDMLDGCDEIYKLYNKGVRLMALTWNYDNIFATSCTTKCDTGLTKEGEKAIKIMNNLGIVIDVSHASYKCINDILNISTYPIIASHSNCYNVCNNKRNLTDDLIIKIADKKGVIGVNAYSLFVNENVQRRNIDGLIEHIKYLKNLVGVDCISFGFDFLGFMTELNNNESVEGLNGHKDLQNLVACLYNNGFTKEEVEKMCYKNIFKIVKNVMSQNH